MNWVSFEYLLHFFLQSGARLRGFLALLLQGGERLAVGLALFLLSPERLEGPGDLGLHLLEARVVRSCDEVQVLLLDLRVSGDRFSELQVQLVFFPAQALAVCLFRCERLLGLVEQPEVARVVLVQVADESRQLGCLRVGLLLEQLHVSLHVLRGGSELFQVQ